MNGTALRVYDCTGRYYTASTDDDDIGKRRQNAQFSLRAIASGSTQQSLNPSSKLMLRMGGSETVGGYAVLNERQVDEFFGLLAYPPEEDGELVRDSTRVQGVYIDPWMPSPDSLVIDENDLQRLAVFVEPLYTGDSCGVRIQLDGSTANTPYVELTPAQYTDLAHAIKEFLHVWPDYRTAQSCPSEYIPATGSTTELAPPQQMGGTLSTNLLGLRSDSQTTSQKQAHH